MDWTSNKSQHTKLTLEKKIHPPLLPGFELATFRSRVRRSKQQAIPAPTTTGTTIITDDDDYDFLFPFFLSCKGGGREEKEQQQKKKRMTSDTQRTFQYKVSFKI